jgi:hypothetical protein
MFYTVYKITNKISGSYYIGKHKTKNLNDDYMGSGKLIRRAIKKYGIENFVKEYLFIYDNEQEMNNKEAEIVTEAFCLQNNTYNICRGGTGGFSYINRTGKNLYGKNGENGKKSLSKANSVLKELRKDPCYRASKSQKLKLAQKESYKKGRKNGFFGKSHSDTTKKRIGITNSILQSGTRNSQFGTMWITDGIANKKIKVSDQIDEGWKKGRTINKF